MIEREYRREMDRVFLDPERMDRISQAMVREKPGRKLRLGRAVLLAACLCLALTVSALALSPALRERLAQAMGSFGPYSQSIENVSAVDQGYEVSVLSAVTDRRRVKIYLQVKDLTGVRMLDEHNELAAAMLRGTEAGTLAGDCVDYDPETHTALFELSDYQDEPTGLEEEIVLAVKLIEAQHYRFQLTRPLPKELISPKPLRCITQEDGRTVLAPGQTAAPLEGVDKAELSSMGFASDGTFQVMVRLADGASVESYDSYLLTDVFVNGEFPCEQMDEIRYTLDGASYVGLIFTNIDPDDLDGLEFGAACVGVDMGEQVEGSWELPFQVENLPDLIELPLRGAVSAHPFPATLTLTPLGGTITGSYETGYLGERDFAIVYDGGERITDTVQRPGRMNPNGLCCLANWDFGEPVDLSRAVALELGDWYIPLTGEDAGTVYPIEGHP